MPSTSPANRYLDLIRVRIDQIKADLPKLIDLGERMCRPLIDGGGLFTPQIGTFWPSEFGGRAGGVMGLQSPTYIAQNASDVAYTTLPDPRRKRDPKDDRLRKLIESPAQIFIIGREDAAEGIAPRDRFAGFTGGASPTEGLYARSDIQPLAPIRPFEQLVRGWLVAGEMIAAATRAGRMPIIWMSVWLEGAFVRNATFFKHDNLREPWYTPLFHERIYIPPLAPGYVAKSFLAELEAMHALAVRQAAQLARAGDWMAEAIKAKRQISTVAVGHSYPEILEIAEPKDYPLSWLPSISDLRHAHPSELSSGDVALHLGYAPVDVADVRKILDRGVRFIYSSPYGRPAALADHPNLLWLDLPWRPGDATVDVPGYSVRILPMSSSAHTMFYFALICELAERMEWR